VRALLAYQVYERDDRTLRALAAKNRAAAIAYDIGTAPGQSDWAFNRYSAALSSVVVINQDAFTSAVAAGQGNPLPDDLLPAAGAALLVVLALLGVRPRLAEYEQTPFRPTIPVTGGAGDIERYPDDDRTGRDQGNQQDYAPRC